MAENKKSFLLYCDLIHTVSKMPKEKAGELFMHILEYVNDKDPQTDDLIIQLTFEPIKQALKRDLQKYENIRLKNIENANKRWNKNNATASDRMQTDTKNAVNDNVSDSVNDNVKVIKDIKERKREFYNSLIPFLETYSKEMLKDFFDYWTEHGEKDKKFRKEKEKSFNTELRLKTWYKRSKEFKEKNVAPKKEKLNAGEIIKQKYGLS